MIGTASVRELVGDLRYALATQLRDVYPRPDGVNGFSHTAERDLFRELSGFECKPLEADYYIAPGDGAGPIVVEIGEESREKWKAVIAKDGRPIRVLHVALDRRMRLDYPRQTPFEGDLLRVLGKVYREDTNGHA